MALTISNKGIQFPAGIARGIRFRIATITFDSSYPTGGEAVQASDFNLNGIYFIGFGGFDADAAAGYFPRFDIENSKIEVHDYDSEVANTTDLSALEFTALVIGY